ncbi:MAG: hypothetical protein GQ559_04755 [Desulfobulbaceae bacterium]|nr:hypothetical protein [Desulfobulbaceae bacterium]
MPSLHSIFSKIEDGKSVRIALPVTDSVDKLRISCIYNSADAPHFSLLFTPGALPVQRIDRHRKCTVLLDLAGQSISLAADIERIEDDQTLWVVAREVINHEQLRDYFRVDVATPIVAAPLLPAELAGDGETWQLTGETIDVSGSGILASFPQPIETGKPVRVDLVLPTGETKVVKTVAHVVRTKKIDDNLYHIALNFERIETESRDRIMACCFDVQRKHLRLKVRVKNTE